MHVHPESPHVELGQPSPGWQRVLEDQAGSLGLLLPAEHAAEGLPGSMRVLQREASGQTAPALKRPCAQASSSSIYMYAVAEFIVNTIATLLWSKSVYSS